VSAHGLETRMDAWRHDTDREDYGTHWPVIVVAGDALKGRPRYDNIIPTDTPGRVFRNLDDAVWRLSGFRPSAGQGTDQRPLRSQVLIWDYRGRIATRTATTRKVVVEVEPRNHRDLVLLGAVDLDGEPEPFGVAEIAPAAFERSFEQDVKAVRFQLWIGTEILDQGSENVPGPVVLSTIRAQLSGQEQQTPPEAYGPWLVVVGRLGSGGQGVVKKVRNIESGEFGVVKVLREKDWPSAAAREKAVDRFRREVTTTKGLPHPCILAVLDQDIDTNEPWAVTEFMPHGSLNGHLSVYRGDQWRSLRIARDVALALGAVHDKKRVHRDVKPENILLRDLDHAVLGDFGIVHDADATDLTATDEVVGPRWFMPPEAETGRLDEPTASFDVYSLGKVIWTMLSGGSARFLREGFRDEAFNLVTLLKRPDFEVVNSLLDKMITFEPDRRFQSMADVVNGIDRLSFGAPVPVGPAETRATLARRLRALLRNLDGHLADSVAGAYDPKYLVGEFEKYNSIRNDVALVLPAIARDLQIHKMAPSKEAIFEDRGAVSRSDLEALRRDVEYAVGVIEEPEVVDFGPPP
jgi:tRNA A-37 threonylcarbamoyl transferase component Bud32